MALVDRCPFCTKWIEKATQDQQGRLEMICEDLAAQCEWPRNSGCRIDAKAWSALLMAAFERQAGRKAEIYPSIDQPGFDVVYRRRSRLSKVEASELIEFANAFAVENGVILSKSKRERREEEEAAESWRAHQERAA